MSSHSAEGAEVMSRTRTLVIKIDMSNAAFHGDDGDVNDWHENHAEGFEVARILKEIAYRMESHGVSEEFTCNDLNGNKVCKGKVQNTRAPLFK